MQDIKLSLCDFRNFLYIGAISIQHENINATFELNSFSHCTRSKQSGGALYFNSNKGICDIEKNCFEWCFTNTPENVDYGQSTYSSCSRTIFSDNTFSFCSPDDAVIRNSGFCCEIGDATAERVNASHGYCYYSAGMEFRATSKATVSDCTMFNLTSTSLLDTICDRYSTGNSFINRLIYILCENPKSGTPNYQSNNKLTIQNSVFVSCTNFDSSYYSDKTNIHKTTDEVENLVSKQRECPKRSAVTDCLRNREKHISLIITLMMSLIQLYSSSSSADNMNLCLNLDSRLTRAAHTTAPE